MLEKFLKGGGVNVRGVFVLGGNCPGGICPGVIVRGVIVLIPGKCVQLRCLIPPIILVMAV